MASFTSSYEYFKQLKALADKMDQQVQHLEDEARHKLLMAKGNESGFAAPICDDMSNAIDEMSVSVDAISLEVEKNVQSLNQVIGQAIAAHDEVRTDFSEVVDYAVKYGYQVTKEDQDFIDNEIDVSALEKNMEDLTEKKNDIIGPSFVKSPNLFETGISKETLQSMGIHFRNDHQVRQMTSSSDDTLEDSVFERANVKCLTEVSTLDRPEKAFKCPETSDEDESTDGFSPAPILKMSIAPDTTMEVSRVEISPGLKIRPKKSTKPKTYQAFVPPAAKHHDESGDIPEFSTVDVQSLMSMYGSARKLETPTILEEPVLAKQNDVTSYSSPELPILKTMDISKLFQQKNNQQSILEAQTPVKTVANETLVETPPAANLSKENKIIDIQSPDNEEIMAILRKY